MAKTDHNVPDRYREPSDQVAWWGLLVGVLLMFGMVFVAALGESDGDYRSWATIRLHGRFFLCFAALALAFPVAVFAAQWVQRFRRRRAGNAKPPSEDDL